MRGNAYAQKQVTSTDSRLRLIALLCGCRDEMLFGFTAGELGKTHKLHANHVRNEREIEALLLARQDKRRREIAG